MDLRKSASENAHQYIWRVCNAKDNGSITLSWEELSEIFNRELGIPEDRQQTEASFRKPYQQAKTYYENVFSPMIQNQGSSDYLENIVRQQEELYTIKTQVQDQRRAYHKNIRESSRLSHRIDMLEEILCESGESRYKGVEPAFRKDDGNDLFIMLSDMHIGMKFDSFNGSYDLRIAKSRLDEYARNIIRIGDRHHSQNAFVSITGDNISGFIHRGLDVENEETAILQVKDCSEMVADFVANLSEHFGYVSVNSVSGNHSRLTAKGDSHVSERLDDIIPWYLHCAVQSLQNVNVTKEKKWNGTAALHTIRGLKEVSIHGDLDGINDASIGKLIVWLGLTPDIVAMGHRHTPQATRVGNITVVQSGSLVGAGDDYTTTKRLTGGASQTTCVVTKDGIEALYPVAL